MIDKFKGAGVALVTPFTQDLAIDYQAMERLLNHVTNESIDYLVVCGTTGESVTLSQEEKKALLTFIKEKNKENLPVVYGIGGNNTDECLKNIEETDFKGVDAVLSVSPYYNKPSQAGIIRHYEFIADHCPVPVILYNVPGRTSSNLSWQTTRELSKHKNIIGIKEASGNLEQCMQIRKNASKDFLLISGDDLLTVPIMAIGGKGVISVLANAFPSIFRQITKAAAKGDFEKAAEHTFRILEINPLMYVEGNPVGVKEVLRQKGICGDHVRLPHVNASETLKKDISRALSQLEK